MTIYSRDSAERMRLERTTSSWPAISRASSSAFARLDASRRRATRDQRALDEPELALGRGPEAAQVPRLDAGALQFDERAEHRERVLAVVVGGDDERRRDRVLQQHRVRAGLADELLAA